MVHQLEGAPNDLDRRRVSSIASAAMGCCAELHEGLASNDADAPFRSPTSLRFRSHQPAAVMTSTPLSSPSKSSPRVRNKTRRRVDSSGAPASPARAAAARRQPSWEDDEGAAESNDEELLRRAATVAPPKRKRRPPPAPPSSFSPAALLNPLLRLLAFILTPFASWFLTLIIPIILVSLVTYVGISAARSALSSSLSALIPSSLATFHIATGLYCSTIGVGCPRKTDDRVIGAAARQATAKASQALDVFQSLLHLGGEDSQGLALHPVEAWELAQAVKYSGLEEREFLSEQLGELGDRVRDLKDDVISLNSLGLNSFVWIV